MEAVWKSFLNLANFRKTNKKIMQKMQENFFNIHDVNEALFNITCRKCDNNFQKFVMLKKHI